MDDDGQQPEDKQHFIEEVGLFFERPGLTRMAGRMLGWLLICDPPLQTMQQIAAALQASKGSISATSRYLIHIGLVERVCPPGERRDYYRLRPHAWYHIMLNRLAEVVAVREMAERGLDLLDGAAPEQRQRLEEMRDMYALFEREIPLMLERWKQQQSDRTTD